MLEQSLSLLLCINNFPPGRFQLILRLESFHCHHQTRLTANPTPPRASNKASPAELRWRASMFSSSWYVTPNTIPLAAQASRSRFLPFLHAPQPILHPVLPLLLWVCLSLPTYLPGLQLPTSLVWFPSPSGSSCYTFPGMMPSTQQLEP